MTKSIAMIVAGAVGPTETRLALCGLDAGRPIVVTEETAPNSAAPSLAQMVHRFLRKFRPPQVRSAAFAVGGSPQGGDDDASWMAAASALAAELSMDRITVMSDAEGMAHALAGLSLEDLAALNGDESTESGNQAVLAIGASPSVAGLYWNGTEHRCFASEGASADFAPRNEDEAKLGLFLAKRVERVTLGLVLSRAGIAHIHAFVRGEEAPAGGEDLAAAILRDGATAKDPAAARTLQIFLGLCGSAAANLALSLRATGGVYLGGDVVPDLRELLGGAGFKAAFSGKPPMEALLRKVPVHAILNRNAALLGAATVAARELRAQRGSGWAS